MSKKPDSQTIVVDRDLLSARLKLLAKVIEKKNSIPILDCVYLEVFRGRLRLSGSDLDMDLATSIRIKGGRRGAVAVPFEGLVRAVRNIAPGAGIEVALGGKSLALRAPGSSFDLVTLPAADWPAWRDPDYSHHFEMPSAVAEDALSRVAFAISTEETRYYLNGVYIHPVRVDRRLRLRFVATDGHRLSLVDVKRPAGATKMPPVIVPAKTVAVVRALLTDGETVGIQVGAKGISVSSDNFVLRSKVIDGTYPDYMRVIPKESKHRTTFDASALEAAVSRLRKFVGKDGTQATLMKFGRADACDLSVRNFDLGTSVETVAAPWSGDPMEIGFNARYLIDAVRALKADELSFDLVDGATPATMAALGGAHQVVLMPMRV